MAGNLSANDLLVFSPDSQLLAFGYAHEGGVGLWNAATGEVITFSGALEGLPSAERFIDLSFSHDGALLIAGNGICTVLFWDVAQQREVKRLTDHRGEVTNLLLSADGRLLVSSAIDGTIRFYGVRTG